MGPLALQWWTQEDSVRPILAKAQHFLLKTQFLDTALKAAIGPSRTVNWEFGWTLPAPVVCVELPELVFLVYEQDGEVMVLNHAWRGVTVESATRRKSNLVRQRLVGHGDHAALLQQYPDAFDDSLQLAAQVDAALSLICEPRLVQLTPPSRPQRRRAERVLGNVGLPTWHTVSWTIGEATRPKNCTSDGEWRAPLHFSRAHWRGAKESHPSSQLRVDAPGWWVWVKHSWKGHPDFGVTPHRYAPKIKPDESELALVATRDAMIAAWQHDQAQKSLKGANHA